LKLSIFLFLVWSGLWNWFSKFAENCWKKPNMFLFELFNGALILLFAEPTGGPFIFLVLLPEYPLDIFRTPSL
jgi:hypothetical protein